MKSKKILALFLSFAILISFASTLAMPNARAAEYDLFKLTGPVTVTGEGVTVEEVSSGSYRMVYNGAVGVNPVLKFTDQPEISGYDYCYIEFDRGPNNSNKLNPVGAAIREGDTSLSASDWHEAFVGLHNKSAGYHMLNTDKENQPKPLPEKISDLNFQFVLYDGGADATFSFYFTNDPDYKPTMKLTGDVLVENTSNVTVEEDEENPGTYRMMDNGKGSEPVLKFADFPTMDGYDYCYIEFERGPNNKIAQNPVFVAIRDGGTTYSASETHDFFYNLHNKGMGTHMISTNKDESPRPLPETISDLNFHFVLYDGGADVTFSIYFSNDPEYKPAMKLTGDIDYAHGTFKSDMTEIEPGVYKVTSFESMNDYMIAFRFKDFPKIEGYKYIFIDMNATNTGNMPSVNLSCAEAGHFLIDAKDGREGGDFYFDGQNGFFRIDNVKGEVLPEAMSGFEVRFHNLTKNTDGLTFSIWLSNDINFQPPETTVLPDIKVSGNVSFPNDPDNTAKVTETEPGVYEVPLNTAGGVAMTFDDYALIEGYKYLFVDIWASHPATYMPNLQLHGSGRDITVGEDFSFNGTNGFIRIDNIESETGKNDGRLPASLENLRIWFRGHSTNPDSRIKFSIYLSNDKYFQPPVLIKDREYNRDLPDLQVTGSITTDGSHDASGVEITETDPGVYHMTYSGTSPKDVFVNFTDYRNITGYEYCFFLFERDEDYPGHNLDLVSVSLYSGENNVGLKEDFGGWGGIKLFERTSGLYRIDSPDTGVPSELKDFRLRYYFYPDKPTDVTFSVYFTNNPRFAPKIVPEPDSEPAQAFANSNLSLNGVTLEQNLEGAMTLNGAGTVEFSPRDISEYSPKGSLDATLKPDLYLLIESGAEKITGFSIANSDGVTHNIAAGFINGVNYRDISSVETGLLEDLNRIKITTSGGPVVIKLILFCNEDAETFEPKYLTNTAGAMLSSDLEATDFIPAEGTTVTEQGDSITLSGGEAPSAMIDLYPDPMAVLDSIFVYVSKMTADSKIEILSYEDGDEYSHEPYYHQLDTKTITKDMEGLWIRLDMKLYNLGKYPVLKFSCENGESITFKKAIWFSPLVPYAAQKDVSGNIVDNGPTQVVGGNEADASYDGTIKSIYEQTFACTGVLKDKNGRPLADMTIILNEDKTCKTDANGAFTLDALSLDMHKLNIKNAKGESVYTFFMVVTAFNDLENGKTSFHYSRLKNVTLTVQ